MKNSSYSIICHFNYRLQGKNSGFVDSGFVKTCDELVIGPKSQKSHSSHGAQCWSHIAIRSTKMGVRYDPTIYSGQRFLNCPFFHVSTKLIHNGIKIMICYKQYQWQFNEAMYNESKVPMVNLHLKCLMKFTTLYNQIIFKKNSN